MPNTERLSYQTEKSSHTGGGLKIKNCSQKFHYIHRKTTVLPEIQLKRDSNTDSFLLWNFGETPILRTAASGL